MRRLIAAAACLMFLATACPPDTGGPDPTTTTTSTTTTTTTTTTVPTVVIAPPAANQPVALDTDNTVDASNNGEMTPDGRYVVFSCVCKKLIPGFVPGVHTVFRLDRLDNTYQAVSTDLNGGAITSGPLLLAGAGQPSISDDGRYVAFESVLSNHVAGDDEARTDVFVRDMVTGVTTRVSESATTEGGNANSTLPVISGNGRYVVFRSLATNLGPADGNAKIDIYRWDRTTGAMAKVTIGRGAGGTAIDSNGDSTLADDSALDDGRVIFRSDATNLITSQTIPISRLYLANTDAGTTSLISVLSSGANVNSTLLAATPTGSYAVFNYYDGVSNYHTAARSGSSVTDALLDPLGNWVSFTSATVSSDGRYLAFATTDGDLVPGDTNSAADVFVLDRTTGQIKRASKWANGTFPGGVILVNDVSDDGRTVAYTVDGGAWTSPDNTVTGNKTVIAATGF